MSDYGLFWDSRNGDRKYGAASMEEWLKPFFTTGVFNGEMQVTAASGMKISVAAGYCNIQGKIRKFKAAQVFTLQSASGYTDRVDAVVVERNEGDREISVKVVTGTSTTPPAPVRENGIYQIVLAHISVGRGVTSITQSSITDKRMDSSLCGWVVATVDEIDFTQIAAQFDAWSAEKRAAFSAWMSQVQAEFSNWMSGEQVDFETWKNTQQTGFESWRSAQDTAFSSWRDTQESAFASWRTAQENAFSAWMSDQQSAFTTWMTSEQSDYSDWKDEMETDFETWQHGRQQGFEDWVAGLENILDEETAGHLQLEIEDLQDDVSVVQRNVSTIQGDITTIQGDITTIQGDITTIQGDITTIQGDVFDLETAVASAGHDIRDSNGNLQTKRKSLQFSNIFNLADDSQGDKTVISSPISIVNGEISVSYEAS